MSHQDWLAGASSGSRAAKTLRKHAQTCVLAGLACVPRALLQIFHHDHAELALDQRVGDPARAGRSRF
jgi:hypothetical protein